MQRFAAQLTRSRLLQHTDLGSFTVSLLCTVSGGTNAPWHQNRPYDHHLLVLSSQHLFFTPVTEFPFPEPLYPRHYSGVSTSPRPGQSEHSLSRVISSVQFSCSVMSDSLRPHGLKHTRLPCPSPTPKLAQTHVIESVMPSNHLILCGPLLLLPSLFPSIRVFSNESILCIRWPKYWSFSFSISPSNEYSGLISFRIDWLDLLAVQGTLKSLLQYHSSKASVLQCSAFFIVQLSHPYMTTGKTIALTRWTFVGKVMSLLFNMLSRLVITFLLLISWLQLPSAVILEAKKIKSATVSTVSPSICHEVMGQMP